MKLKDFLNIKIFSFLEYLNSTEIDEMGQSVSDVMEIVGPRNLVSQVIRYDSYSPNSRMNFLRAFKLDGFMDVGDQILVFLFSLDGF